jgi:heat shock protein HslJ
MKRYVQLAALFAAIVSVQTACVSGGGNAGGGANVQNFSDVSGRNWKLMEVRAGKDVIFERGMLTPETPKDVFTLRFDSERVSGAGCPNRYFAPYTLAEKQAINIEPIAGTLMIALFEPEQLREREFFAYLENADQWNLVKGNLELRSTNSEGKTVLLVFSSGD